MSPQHASHRPQRRRARGWLGARALVVVLAAVAEGYDGITSASLLLMHRPGARAWTQLGVSAWGGAAISPRRWTAPTVTPTGVRAYLDGGEEGRHESVRWSLTGRQVRAIRGRRVTVPSMADGVAFDGDRLISLGQDCGEETGCEVLSSGPVALG